MQVEQNIKQLVADLKPDPQALETIYFSIITFNNQPKQEYELVSLIDFPDDLNLKTTGGTELGKALRFTAERANSEVRKRTPTNPADWKPVFILMSDGAPTDDWRSGLEVLQQTNVKWGLRIAGAVDEAYRNETSLGVLNEVIAGDNPKEGTYKLVPLSTANPREMADFFQWLTQTLRGFSNSVGTNEGGSNFVLPPLPGDSQNLYI